MVIISKPYWVYRFCLWNKNNCIPNVVKSILKTIFNFK